MVEDVLVDPETLREQVRDKYRAVAVEPHARYHFHTGRPLAVRLGYDSAIAAALPARAVAAFQQALYFTAQGHWLLSRFPQASFQAVPGLCKAVTREEIAANDFSLTPGRYVGVAANGADDEDAEAFAERMREIHVELAELNAQAVELAAVIQANFAELVA